MTFGSRYLCTDRQDYIVNWGDRKEKKTVQLTAISTADHESGYVFGISLTRSAYPEDRDSLEPHVHGYRLIGKNIKRKKLAGR